MNEIRVRMKSALQLLSKMSFSRQRIHHKVSVAIAMDVSSPWKKKMKERKERNNGNQSHQYKLVTWLELRSLLRAPDRLSSS